MTDNNSSGVNKFYIISLTLLLFILPVVSFFIEWLISNTSNILASFGKWFIFYAAGVRLFMAGIKQISNPSFTAKTIFHFKTNESLPVIKELGFANLCSGLVGIISLFLPQWRIVSAFSSGLFYGFAGFGHLAKKPAGANEKFAMVTDIIIFILLMVYVIIFYLEY